MTNEDIQTDLTFNRLEKSLTVGEVKAAVKEILFLLEDRKDMERVSDYHFFRGENVSGYWIFFINRGLYDGISYKKQVYHDHYGDIL